jgi:TPP-dependent pyruvate/acetoin dehydrogenase alpha subunit
LRLLWLFLTWFGTPRNDRDDVLIYQSQGNNNMEMPSNEILLKLYRDLLTARRVEARIFEIVKSMGGSGGHRGPGEEVIPIAICNNLTQTDCFHPNFRTAFCLFVKPGFTLVDTVAQNLGKKSEHNPWFTTAYGTMGSSGTLGEPAVKYFGATVANVIKKTVDVTVFVQGTARQIALPPTRRW